MRITPFCPTSFKRNIIDSHMHTGKFFDNDYTVDNLDVFMKNPLNNGDVVSKAVISNLSCMDDANTADEIDGNLETLEIAYDDERFIPLAVCKPKDGNVKNIKRLFMLYPGMFKGLKFRPDGHNLSVEDKRYIPYLKFAQDNDLPCLFHCAINWDQGKLVDKKYRYSEPKKYTKLQKNSLKLHL